VVGCRECTLTHPIQWTDLEGEKQGLMENHITSTFQSTADEQVFPVLMFLTTHLFPDRINCFEVDKLVQGVQGVQGVHWLELCVHHTLPTSN
jgi:hypothetical protein